MFAPQTPIFDENASTTTPSPSAPLHKRSLSTPGPQGFATPKSKAKTFGTPSRRFGANLTNTGGKQSVNRQHSVQKKVAFQIPPLTPSNIYAAPSSSSARPGRSTPHRKTVSFTSAPPLGIFQDSSAAASLPPPSLLSPVETAAGRQGQQETLPVSSVMSRDNLGLSQVLNDYGAGGAPNMPDFGGEVDGMEEDGFGEVMDGGMEDVDGVSWEIDRMEL